MITKEPVPVLQSLLTIITEDWLFTLIKQREIKLLYIEYFLLMFYYFIVVVFGSFCLSYSRSVFIIYSNV